MDATATPEYSSVTASHIALFVPLWIVCIFLNLFGAIVMGRNAYLKKSMATVLLFTLSATDLFLLIAGLLPSAITSVYENLLYSTQPLCHYQSTVLNASRNFSSLVTVMIAFDRYFAIAFPFVYNRKISEGKGMKLLYAVLVLAAVVALAIALLPLILGLSFQVIPPGLYCMFDWRQKSAMSRAVSLVNVAIGLITIASMVYFTAAICIGLWRVTKARKQERNKLEIYIVNVTLSICILFIFCSTPFLVTIIVQQFTPYSDQDVSFIALSVLFLNSALDPVLYVIVTGPIRRGCIDIFKWMVYICFCCWTKKRPKKTIDEVLEISNKRSPVILHRQQHQGGIHTTAL